MFDGYKCQWGDGDFRSRFFNKLYSLMFGQDVKKQVHIYLPGHFGYVKK